MTAWRVVFTSRNFSQLRNFRRVANQGRFLILAEYNETVEWFHTKFSNTYKVSQFERCKVYNGINVQRLDKHCYTLSQEYSIAQFLAKCPVQDINACDSPLLPSDTFVLAKEDDTDAVDRMKRTTYQQVIRYSSQNTNFKFPLESQTVVKRDSK